ncbi:MAG: hypothetical protein B5M53_06915 [Candidatus Cloacimonas sp. 4484_209]|nr:MAG: hypothetical protein B5M53_06915 [Candidatus Cloacimonas sp. 4484_209]
MAKKADKKTNTKGYLPEYKQLIGFFADVLNAEDIKTIINRFIKFIEENLADQHHHQAAIFVKRDKDTYELLEGHKWVTLDKKIFKLSKNNIIGYVIKSNKEFLTNDITKEKKQLEGLTKVKSVFAIPLVANKKTIGAMAFAKGKSKKWTVEEISFLRATGLIVSNAIYNINLKNEISYYSETIENQKHFINSLINSFPSGIIIVDKDGNITLINKKAQEVFGFLNKEMDNISIKQLFDSKRASINPFLKTIKENKPLTRLETNIVKKDGKEIPIGFSTSPLRDSSGKITGVIGVMRELTDIKQMEERLRRQDRLVALGEMAAGMAHEIRNPLAGIKTGVEYLGRFLDEKNKNAVSMIVKEIDRLNRIVTDMTQYANRPPLKWDQVNIHNTLNISLAFLENEIENKNIEIIKKFDEHIPPVELDSDQIRQVFDNIILNAIQASEQNGKVIISTTLVKNNRVEIKIVDSGVGISEKDSERIFNPFFTTKKGGTGLGLSICHRIVSEHNGHISITSKKEEGTTVKIILPVKH